MSPLGRVVAFAGRRGRVWTIDQEGDRVFRFNPVPVTGTAHAVVVAGENCKEGEGDPGTGCSIAVNGPHRAFYTTSHGIVDRVPRLRQVTTGRGRWLGGITSFSDFGSCSTMMRRLFVRWSTCDNQLGDIAPDNRHVLGTPAYADGFGPKTLDPALDLRAITDARCRPPLLCWTHAPTDRRIPHQTRHQVGPSSSPSSCSPPSCGTSPAS